MIPDYQTLMRPLLECIQDGQEHLFKNVIEQLADRFELTREEREQLAPSGHRALFSGRVGWAKTYLKKAGLLEQRKRGILSITSLGIKALKSKKKIDVTYLTGYPNFVDFYAPSSRNDKTRENECAPAIDPEETIAHAYEQIHNKLSSELLDVVLMQDFAFFERLVVELLVKMGYGGSIQDAGQAIGRTGDEGIDGIIKAGSGRRPYPGQEMEQEQYSRTSRIAKIRGCTRRTGKYERDFYHHFLFHQRGAILQTPGSQTGQNRRRETDTAHDRIRTRGHDCVLL